MEETQYARYMSLKDGMNYLGISSYNSLYRLIQQGMPVIVIENTKKLDRMAIDRWLKEHSV